MPRFVIASKSGRDKDDPSPTSERLVNLYAVPAPEGSRAQFTLRNPPGTRTWAQVPATLRAMLPVEGVLYVVAQGNLYSVAESGTVTLLGSVADGFYVSMSGNRSNVAMSIGYGTNGTYYLWNGSSVSTPGSGRLTNVGSVAFLDQFTLLFDDNGREVEWTEVGTPGTRNALYFATAEGRDDKIVRGMDAGAYFVVFKEKSLELWANTKRGQQNAFLRVEGGVREIGLRDHYLACKAGEALFFIGSDRTARMLMQGDPVHISTPPVDQALQRDVVTHCFYFEDRGHRFCVIRFQDRPAWIYDASMGQWFERSSGPDHGPWDVVASAFVYGRWHLATASGAIHRLGVQPYDADAVMRRTAVARPVYVEGRRFTVPELEVLGRFGRFGANDTDAKMWIRTSRDGGNTWSLPKIATVGKTGEYEARAVWRALGQFRNFTVEINITDPVDVPILSEGNIRLG